jgi:LPS sulfotransferase NodH
VSKASELLQRPIVIVSTPRSGSTFLYEILEQAPGLFTTGQESHWLIEDIPGLAPPDRGWSSNRLTVDDVTPERSEAISREFYRQLRDRAGAKPNGPVRMLEKTPKNALRVPFFNAIWPDSIFVYLHRDVRDTLASMMEAWDCGAFRTYPKLPGWTGYPWSLLLVPGWRQLAGRSLPEIVAHQWAITTDILLDDLKALPRERLRILSYESLRASPQAVIEPLADSLGLKWDRQLGPRLPLSKTTVSRPRPDKWRRLESVVEAVLPIVAPAEARVRAFVGDFAARRESAARNQ